MNENAYPFFFLNTLANTAQLIDLELNLTQISNDTLFAELQNQNKEYLQKIIEQNEMIIKQNEEILKRLNNSTDTQVV